MAAIDPDPVWPALIASAGSVATGVITVYFKLFIESNADFRSRISLRREKLTEQFAVRLVALLKHVQSMTMDDVLRGDGHEEPDLVGDVSKECRKLVIVLHRMEIIRAAVRLSYSFIFCAIVFGLVGTLIAGLWADSRPYVFWVAVGLFLFQVAVVCCVMRASAILEVYEDV